MGVVIIMTAPLMGVVYSNPLKKANILSATPKNAAATNLGKSLESIFLVGVTSPKSQNSIPLQTTLIKIKPKGLMCPPTITSLANVKVKP